MSASANFRKQHVEILELAKNIDANLPRLPAAAGDVRAQLNSLAAKVNVHLAIEDEALYPRLQAFAGEMAGIKDAFQKYLRIWSEGAIRGNAAGFAAETKSLFGVLTQRIQRENTELYPLLDKVG